MFKQKGMIALLIVWLCFLAFVTWIDWLGIFTFLIVILGVVPTQITYVIVASVLIFIVIAVVGSAHTVHIQHVALALGILWLLGLPFIPWTAEKALITHAAMLVPGMTKAEVQAIMTAHPGVHDAHNNGIIFCADPNWHSTSKDGGCEHASIVMAEMVNGHLASVLIDWD